MMDLVALRSLIAVDVHGTVAAAATAGGYTPSAVSQQIKRLEKDLGAVLLERVGRGVVLTDQGRNLVRHGHGILRQVEAATAGIGGEEGEAAGPLRIVAFSTSVRGLIAPLLADLARTSPDLVPELFERDPHEAVDTVASGQADVGLVHHWVGVPLHRPDFVAGQLLGYDTADLLVHADHPLARAERVTPADLVDEAWVSTPVGTICHGWFLYMFAGFARPPRVRYWSLEFASHVRLVEEAQAVALVPRLGRGVLPESVVAVEVAGPSPTRVIEMIWRDSMSASPAVRHVRERCAALFAGDPELRTSSL